MNRSFAKQSISFAVIALSLLGASAQGATEIELGKQLYEDKGCIGCHGADAKDMIPPRLAGQDSRYLIKELTRFKTNERVDNIMSAMNVMAADLTDEEIKALAAFLSKEEKCSIPVNQDPLDCVPENGKKIFEYQVCYSCHFADNKFAAPVIVGQKTDYLATTLKAFRERERPSRFMNDLTAGMSDQDLSDLAAYVNSLGEKECKAP